MEFTIKENEKTIEFIELFKFMKNLDQYVTMICNKENMNIQLMDSAHVSLFHMNIHKDWFETYNCEEENCTFSINNNIFTKLLSLHTKDNIIECKINEDTLSLNYLHSEQNKYFSISLIDVEKELLTPNYNDTDLDFKIKTKLMDKYINDLSIFGEDLEIKYKDDKLYLESSNEEGSLLIQIDYDKLLECNSIDDLDFTCKYPSKYIQYITKLRVSYSNMVVFLDSESPLRIHFENKHINIDYFIAPKMED